MDTSLDRIRAKIAELEAKIADLRIAERELMELGAGGRRITARRAGRARLRRTEKRAAAPARQTISSAITDVLSQHGALPASEIADYIKAAGRDVERRSVSYSLQALKKQGRVRIRGGKWILPKTRSKRASA